MTKATEAHALTQELVTYLEQHPNAQQALERAVDAALVGGMIPVEVAIERVTLCMYGQPKIETLLFNFGQLQQALQGYLPQYLLRPDAGVLIGKAYDPDRTYEPSFEDFGVSDD